jgi:hypothetical protein
MSVRLKSSAARRVAVVQPDNISVNDADQVCLSGHWKLQNAETRFFSTKQILIQNCFKSDVFGRTTLGRLEMAPQNLNVNENGFTSTSLQAQQALTNRRTKHKSFVCFFEGQI